MGNRENKCHETRQQKNSGSNRTPIQPIAAAFIFRRFERKNNTLP
jgi:hypothetical protein